MPSVDTVDVAAARHAARHAPGAEDDLSQWYGQAAGSGVTNLKEIQRTLRFTSLSGAPVMQQSDFPNFSFQNPRMFRPYIVRMEGKIDNPIARYYCYASTDHGTTAGKSGIFLWTADAMTGPWTARGAGPVYVDTDGGVQTEFPTVIWDSDTRQLLLYYIYNIDGTSLAISQDGLTWEKITSFVIPRGPLDMYTGYLTVSRLASNDLIGHHLLGINNAGAYGLSRSKDGITWVNDSLFVCGNLDTTLDPARQSPGPNEWFTVEGETWGFGSIKRTDVGGGKPGDQAAVCGPVRSDYRSWARVPQECWVPQHPWEQGDFRSMSTIFVDDDESVYGIYRGGNGSGFGIARGDLVVGEAL